MSVEVTLRRSKRNWIAPWTLARLLSLVFAAVSLPKLLGNAAAAEGFQAMGYPLWFLYVVGAIVLSGAVLLLLPSRTLFGAPLRFWGCLVLMTIVVGAIGAGIRQGILVGILVPAGLLVLLAGLPVSAHPRGHQPESGAGPA